MICSVWWRQVGRLLPGAPDGPAGSESARAERPGGSDQLRVRGRTSGACQQKKCLERNAPTRSPPSPSPAGMSVPRTRSTTTGGRIVRRSPRSSAPSSARSSTCRPGFSSSAVVDAEEALQFTRLCCFHYLFWSATLLLALLFFPVTLKPYFFLVTKKS